MAPDSGVAKGYPVDPLQIRTRVTSTAFQPISTTFTLSYKRLFNLEPDAPTYYWATQWADTSLLGTCIDTLPPRNEPYSSHR